MLSDDVQPAGFEDIYCTASFHLHGTVLSLSIGVTLCCVSGASLSKLCQFFGDMSDFILFLG